MKKTFKLLMLALVGMFALASCEDVPAPYPNPNGETNDKTDEIIAPVGDGTLQNPYNVAGVVAFIETLGTDVTSNEAVYVKGKVKSNSTTESTISQYGNMTFTMVDEGNSTTTFTAFQVYGPDKKKFTSVDQIKEGDEVIVYGKVVNYRGNTPETEGKGQAYVVSINGEGIETPPITETKEATCAEAAELTNALEDGATSVETYSVTGYITEVFATVSKGQQSFWMADTKDGGKVLQAYWANLPKGVEAFKVGSKVKITGNLLKYVKDGKVTPEIKNATVEILDEGSDIETPPSNVVEATCAQAVDFTNALADGATSEDTYSISGYITEVVGTVSRNQQSFWMADTKDGGKVFEAYYANLPEGTEAFVVGSKVKITGKLLKYVKDGKVTPEMKNADVEIIEKGTGSENGNTGDNTGGGSTSSESDAMTIANLPSDITTNAYGSQLAADESTWLTWTWNGIEFKGARVCKANAIDGTIQFQGNDSDATKQGFIFNKTAWSKDISKITIVLKVKSDSKYAPSYSLYAGSTVHPTENAIEPTSSESTDAAGNRVYTQVFNLSKAAAKYFTISNDKAGALYVYSIVVE